MVKYSAGNPFVFWVKIVPSWPSGQFLIRTNLMSNYAAARIHMVDSQIHTMGVTSESVLDSFREVPREQFVPTDRMGIAYNDEDLAIGPGRFLIDPVTPARIMQAVLPQATDTVLDVGGATGYSAALFARIVKRVVALDDNAAFLGHAEKEWAAQGLSNVMAQVGPFAEGCATFAPYSLIFINGSVAKIPQNLIDQLAPEGRLVAVVKGRQDKIGRAVLVIKSNSGAVSERILFDAAVPYLPGFEPKAEFVF
jgi:protein-L-isoaspartate(D-aspartate) O-methyltransferase